MNLSEPEDAPAGEVQIAPFADDIAAGGEVMSEREPPVSNGQIAVRPSREAVALPAQIDPRLTPAVVNLFGERAQRIGSAFLKKPPRRLVETPPLLRRRAEPDIRGNRRLQKEPCDECRRNQSARPNH